MGQCKRELLPARLLVSLFLFSSPSGDVCSRCLWRPNTWKSELIPLLNLTARLVSNQLLQFHLSISEIWKNNSTQPFSTTLIENISCLKRRLISFEYLKTVWCILKRGQSVVLSDHNFWIKEFVFRSNICRGGWGWIFWLFVDTIFFTFFFKFFNIH